MIVCMCVFVCFCTFNIFFWVIFDIEIKSYILASDNVHGVIKVSSRKQYNFIEFFIAIASDTFFFAYDVHQSECQTKRTHTHIHTQSCFMRNDSIDEAYIVVGILWISFYFTDFARFSLSLFVQDVTNNTLITLVSSHTSSFRLLLCVLKYFSAW